MTTFTQDQWMIVALVFILGLLIGMFLTAGGRRKWKARYKEESVRREALEKEHREHQKRFEEREKEYRAQDSLRASATKTHRDPADDRPL